MPQRLVNFVTYVVSTVWALSFLADIVSKSYQPSVFVHLAMMSIVGAAVGKKAFRKDGE